MSGREHGHDQAHIEKLASEWPSGMPGARPKRPMAQSEKMGYWVIPIDMGNELGNYCECSKNWQLLGLPVVLATTQVGYKIIPLLGWTLTP